MCVLLCPKSVQIVMVVQIMTRWRLLMSRFATSAETISDSIVQSLMTLSATMKARAKALDISVPK